MTRRIVLSGLLILMAIILTSCIEKPKTLTSENGQVDWHSNDQLVILNGEWKVYKNTLVSPDDHEGLQDQPFALRKVPSYWKKEKYGTYSLQVRIPDHKIGQPLALKLPRIYTSYEIWIDGNLKKESGKVAKLKDSAIPLGNPETIYFTPTNNDIDILIQVSNFHHRKTGISGLVIVGEINEVQKINKLGMIVTWFTLGALTVLALIQLLFYFHRRKNKIHLYLGLFCALIGFRALLKGNSDIFFIIEKLSWVTAVRLDYIIIFTSISLFSLYMSLYFPKSSKGKFNSITLFVSILSIGVIVFTEPIYFTNLIYIFYVLLFINTPYYLYLAVKGIQEKTEGAKVIGSMFLVLLGTVILDILYNSILVNTTVQTTSLGLIIFFTGQSYVETRRYVTALEQEEFLSEEIENTNREVIMTLGEITETRSKETGNHVRRVAEYSYLLGIKYGLSTDEAELLKVASPLHDIGKVAIPDEILNKPGKLTDEEFEIMKKHSLIGYQMLKYSDRKLIKVSATIAYTHHEKFNGEGYPRGLKGEEIPLFGRITAIADVFDALSNDRVYKKAWEIEDIITYFEQEKGKHFDPKLATIFLENIEEFIKINQIYRDK
ncbi:HD domain-containing phosphohydrolase [Lottiidibacillus patelloidae]|nr:HD domain-containing phosphohydrolase [Lottiidibacillus patelloidae]